MRPTQVTVGAEFMRCEIKSWKRLRRGLTSFGAREYGRAYVARRTHPRWYGRGINIKLPRSDHLE